ncbi:hypothetical protein SAMN02910353_02582 [Ruminococcus sp. YRD2003]|uniref:hypothetical protein n=1 Tax=Ruminococcus sp. YRD2003 TaxID=1452313 RepID=UPI0008C33149|nr:hypothetical protein SAMN02910353_02582 [Ruminococcus flavefaciens]
MTDEMNKNLENEELDLEQLEGISGGLIVDCGFARDYRIVDDKTGEILDSDCYSTESAKRTALDLNVSREIISMDEYKKRFGKDIDLSIRINSKTGKKWIQ